MIDFIIDLIAFQNSSDTKYQQELNSNWFLFLCSSNYILKLHKDKKPVYIWQLTKPSQGVQG